MKDNTLRSTRYAYLTDQIEKLREENKKLIAELSNATKEVEFEKGRADALEYTITALLNSFHYSKGA